jgi:hypothetical protein
MHGTMSVKILQDFWYQAPRLEATFSWLSTRSANNLLWCFIRGRHRIAPKFTNVPTNFEFTQIPGSEALSEDKRYSDLYVC